MKKNYLLFLTVMLFLFIITNLSAQHWVVNQLIVGSGGDWANPDDNVSIASYKPSNEVTTGIGDILTQSIQDIVIHDIYAYVAAQDSIVKFNIDTYQKVASIEAIGINKLLVDNDKLIGSFQYPVTENFVKVYSADDLTLISEIGGVSDESAGLLVVNELAYAAVPGGWNSTVGKIAIISMLDYTLVDEINFDTLGQGIYDLFYFENKIMSVNKTPWGGSTGWISVTNMLGSHTESHLINATIGSIVGVKDTMLYTIMNNGVGSINLNNFSIADTSVVQPPTLTIANAVMDTLNNLFYVASTDYFSKGVGTKYNMLGEELGTFEAGISPDALAIDYRDNTGISDVNSERKLIIYPNPSSGTIIIEVNEDNSFNKFRIIDISGRLLMSDNINLETGSETIDISALDNGLYFLVLATDKEMLTSAFVKK
jgi:hypothetical protein